MPPSCAGARRRRLGRFVFAIPTRECSLGAGETGAMADKDSTRGAADAGTDGGDEATRIVPSSGFSSAPPIPAPTDGGSRQSTIPPGQLLNHTYRVEALLDRKSTR